MRVVITGVAGFIGSTTAELLLRAGHQVEGVDAFTPYYDKVLKQRNLDSIARHEDFRFHQIDIAQDLLDPIFAGADAVLHLAGQPGVRRSWSEFDTYVHANVEGTKAVLDAAVRHRVDRVVYASSSSVYGNALMYPTSEDHPTAPQSPYAVTKLAGEQLCTLYASERKLDTVSLRYFTVYGPRQRPDMLTQRLVQAAHDGSTVTIFGDGQQVRDFTFVEDIARANLAAATADVAPGSVFNVSGGSSVSVLDMIAGVERAAGKRISLVHQGEASGDVRQTGGDCRRARTELDWVPSVSLDEGLTRHVGWFQTSQSTSTRITLG